jgi:O-antigen ligase
MKGRVASTDARGDEFLHWLFSAVLGAFLGLTLLKFGNPPIMEKWVTPPANAFEFVLGNPWPIAWAYGLLVLIALFGLRVASWKEAAPLWLVMLPLIWVLWECVTAMWTVNPALSRPTVVHFIACAGCFYLGYFALGPHWRPFAFWPGLLIALLLVIAVGWEQHFGGLEQTRKYFFMYLYPRMKDVDPEYVKKLSSTRIFSTLFYPNSLAGALLLFLPAILEVTWQARTRFTIGARTFLVVSIAMASLACLYWSGSKGGWLLMLLLGLLWLLNKPLSPKTKRSVILAVLAIGLAAFFWRYSGFFKKGATSVSARFDYWQAALQTALAHPFGGTGPGTFSIAYQQIKKPESEMARLAHNDYLQQASDSGVPGFLLYSLFIGAAVTIATRSFRDPPAPDSTPQPGPRNKLPSSKKQAREEVGGDARDLLFAIWIGVLGWALQSIVEFGLYIPALAWSGFTFLGLLLSQSRGAAFMPLQQPK